MSSSECFQVQVVSWLFSGRRHSDIRRAALHCRAAPVCPQPLDDVIPVRHHIRTLLVCFYRQGICIFLRCWNINFHKCNVLFVARLQCIDQLTVIQAELQDSVKELTKSRKKYQEAETMAQAVREKTELETKYDPKDSFISVGFRSVCLQPETKREVFLVQICLLFIACCKKKKFINTLYIHREEHSVHVKMTSHRHLGWKTL